MAVRQARRVASKEDEVGYAARKAEIRDRARDIFLQHGYRKTSLEDVGRACGLVKGALYYYFGSKEDLFTEVVRGESLSLLHEIRSAVRATDDPKTQIIAMMKTRFRRMGAYLIGKPVVREMTELLPFVDQVRQEYLHEEVRILEEILERGQRAGVFKRVRLKTVPLLMIAALRGIETHLVEVHDAPDFEESMDELLGMMMDAICR